MIAAEEGLVMMFLLLYSALVLWNTSGESVSSSLA